MKETGAGAQHCPVCSGGARIKATLHPDPVAVPIMNCVACDHTFTGRWPASSLPSANAIATETEAHFTESMLRQGEPIRIRQRELAATRAATYFHWLAPQRSRLRILEVGCGTGGFGSAYQELGHEYFGIDIDHRVIAHARQKGLHVRELDLMDLDLAERFDVVFFSQVLEHIMEPRRFLAKAIQHLKPGGIVHLDVPHHYTLAGLPSRIRRTPGVRYGAIDWPHHCMSYSVRSLRALVAGAQDLDWTVSTIAPDHQTWGQPVVPRMVQRAFYFASRLVSRESLVVAIGVARS